MDRGVIKAANEIVMQSHRMQLQVHMQHATERLVGRWRKRRWERGVTALIIDSN